MFLLLLTTSASTCLQHSRNLGPALYWSPVHNRFNVTKNAKRERHQKGSASRFCGLAAFLMTFWTDGLWTSPERIKKETQTFKLIITSVLLSAFWLPPSPNSSDVTCERSPTVLSASFYRISAPAAGGRESKGASAIGESFNARIVLSS